jgi:predicted ATPase/class 3 adenylate cyclase
MKQVIESLIAYIPMDRRQVLATGADLPERMQGSALFADISGFTPMTEALSQALGAQQGAEELTRYLNMVYDALVNQLHAFGGSVIGFSGDAITCWFDGDSGIRAAGCAMAMQAAMQTFASIELPGDKSVALGIKIAISSGTAGRLLVGDPEVQVVDAVFGQMIDTLAMAEHQAEKGEVLLDESTADNLRAELMIRAWRVDPHSGQRFAVIAGTKKPIPPSPWPPIPVQSIPEQSIVPWLLPLVISRLKDGRGEFLAELRPAIALFLSFSGIDYEGDRAVAAKLDDFMRRIQAVLAKYEATLLQLTIGDKGSYIYAAFGAPIAHEDEAVRAASSALEIIALCGSLAYLREVKVGICQGRMRTGAYGGRTRRTYGVLGQAVNMAARLMQAAAPGQILVDQSVQNFLTDTFTFGEQLHLRVKGKADTITAFSLLGTRNRPTIRLQEPRYELPMVGRKHELEIVQDTVQKVLLKQGQVIGISGEAGIGKSRLIAEIIRIGEANGLTGYGGECQSYGTNTSYLVWHSIWQAIFGLNPNMPLEKKIQAIHARIEQIDPGLSGRIPLLAPVLNLPIPDNELTSTFDAKLRKSSLEALLVDCLRFQTRNSPTLLILENCHWLDELSHDLLEVLGRTIADLPVIIVLAYRPPELQRIKSPRLSQLAYYQEISLAALAPDEIRSLIQYKLAKHFSPQSDISPVLIQSITNRSEGNPFYVEELLNYLRDNNIKPSDSRAIELLELPSSLHSLILTRIDQRTESQKATLKVASVIGRQFNASWLWEAYDQLGDVAQIQADLELLSKLDITPLDQPEPELVYLFKHIVTQEVAYESLPYAMRAHFHGQLGGFIECCYCDNTDQCVYLLAHHYERSQDVQKGREYLLRSAELASAAYANDAAIDYYLRLLTLLTAAEQIPIKIKLGKIFSLVGRWQEAEAVFEQALAQADAIGDLPSSAWCTVERAELLGKQGDYLAAAEWLQKAREAFEALDDRAGVGQVLHTAGTQQAQQGHTDQARLLYQESLAIRTELGDQYNAAALLSNLGILARWQSDYALAFQLGQEALRIRQDMGNKWAIAISLSNLGNLAVDQQDYARAQPYLEEAVKIMREVGDRYNLAIMINNLGNAIREQGNLELARTLYKESLTINRELGGQWAMAYVLQDMGYLAVLAADYERALRLIGAASALREEIGAKLSPTEQEKLDQTLAVVRQALEPHHGEHALAEGQKLSQDQAIQYALTGNWPAATH